MYKPTFHAKKTRPKTVDVYENYKYWHHFEANSIVLILKPIAQL